jgi:hypothetical protein
MGTGIEVIIVPGGLFSGVVFKTEPTLISMKYYFLRKRREDYCQEVLN